MSARRFGIAAAVALTVVIGAVVFGGLSETQETVRPPPFPETISTEPPPDFGERPTPAECLAYWRSLMLMGDDDDVEWAKYQLRRTGEVARLEVLAAAQRSVRSNPAFLEHALEYLLEDPQADTLPLARDCLTSRDPFVVTRAATLIGAVGGPGAEEAAEQLAEAAATRENPVPRYALAALAKIGGPRCARAAMDAVERMEPRWTGLGYVALGKMGGEDVIAFLAKAYESQDDPDLRMAAAEGLLVAGDDTPRPWLRSELDRLAEGSPLGEAALQVLANAGDPAALPVLAERVRDRFDAPRAEAAVELLANYALADKEALLQEASGPGNSLDTRLDAWEGLVRSESGGAYEDLLELLQATGPTARDEHRIALLVLGRLQRKGALPALKRFLAFVDPTDVERRSLALRALLLGGDPAAAPTIVKAVVADDNDYGTGGVAFNVYTGLGGAAHALKDALAPELVAALQGEYGTAKRNGLQHLILSAGVCCGPEIAPVVEPFVMHDDREIREAAISVLVFRGREESVHVLRQAWRRRQDEYTRDQLRHALEALHYRAR